MYYLKNQATYSNVPMANKKALLYMYIFIGDRRRAHKKNSMGSQIKMVWGQNRIWGLILAYFLQCVFYIIFYKL